MKKSGGKDGEKVAAKEAGKDVAKEAGKEAGKDGEKDARKEDKKSAGKRVILEPELETIAGELGVFDRLMMAEKMERWVRQLRVSARILAKPRARRTKPPYLTTKQLRRN